MKNLKKVLALVVALTMVLGTVSFAFTDVDSENEVFTAVQTLSSLNILNGYEDGTFGPEKDITRAEFAAVVCRALGVNAAAQTATQFTDVPADHWASGYISYAAGLGIVNGYGDGKFGPEDNVTYEQAVKMLVVALGFEPMAAQKGGWSTGYLVVANQYGMTKGVPNNGEATRGDVAQLVFNALDVPMMIQTGWGTNTSFDVQDGEGGRGYKTLLTELDVEKLDGIVTATPTIGGNTTDEKITYKITNIDAEESEFLNVTTTGVKYIVNNANNLYVADGVNVDEYFGMASTVYAKEFQKGKFEIIAIMPGAASEAITFTREDLAADTITTELKYYESDSATKATRVDISGVSYEAAATSTTPATYASVYYNNVRQTSVTNAANLESLIRGWDKDTVITLYDNDENVSGFDMIVAKKYTHAIVDEVEVGKDRLTTKAADTIKFDFEDTTRLVKLLDKDGNEIGIEDFAEGDVIAYINNISLSAYTWIEVINLGQNKVTGTVKEINTNNNTVSIDGVTYDYDSALTGSNLPAISDEGDFFLRMDGTIFAKDTTSSVSNNYAYILRAAYNVNDAFNPGWQLKLLTKNDGIQIYNMADTFKVTDNADATVNSGGVTTSYAATASGSVQAYGATVPFQGDVTVSSAAVKADAADRLITFKLDSNNKINNVIFINPVEYITEIEYKDAAQKLGSSFIADEAVVFNVSDPSADNAKVLDVNSLVDETKYQGLVAKVDASATEFNCVVITAGAADIDFSQAISVVTGKGLSTDDDGSEITTLTYRTADSEEATLKVDDETKVNGDTGNASVLDKGDIIMFTADAAGVASDISVIANYNSTTKKYELDTTEVGKAISADDENEFIVGYINTWTSGANGRVVTFGGDITVNSAGSLINVEPSVTATDSKWYKAAGSVTSDASGDIVITGDTAQYTFVNNHNDTRGYIEADDWAADPDVDKYDINRNLGTYFFARMFDGVLKDIVVLGDRK